jgi:uncharacterized protein
MDGAAGDCFSANPPTAGFDIHRGSAMPQSTVSPFVILPQSKTPIPVPTPEEREEFVKILADGSRAINGIVSLKIFDREIWYDTVNHTVTRWQTMNSVDGQAVESSDNIAGGSGSCHDCGCNSDQTTESPSVPALGAPADDGNELYRQNKSTLDNIYDLKTEDVVTTIELHVNDKCNFRCDYCYLKEAGNDYLDNEMPEETAFKAVDLMLEGVQVGKTGVVKFFGGEPLLSYRLLQNIVAYGRKMAQAQSKRIVFTINTNGTLLNPHRIAWCQENNVRVSISLDGNEASNNSHRKYAGGRGSYSVVLEKAKMFLEKAGYLMLRATVSDNTFQLKDSMLEFAALGGDGKKVKFQTDFNLVGDIKITLADTEALMNEMSELALVWLGRMKSGEKIPYSNILEPMMKAFYSVKSSYRCGAARTLVAVSPKGTIYPCHRFVDVAAVEMGNVETGLDGRQQDAFLGNRVELKEPCNSCWARYFCGGGCAFNNFFTNANIRDVNNVHCKLFRHQVKLGLYLFTEMKRMATSGTASNTSASRP